MDESNEIEEFLADFDEEVAKEEEEDDQDDEYNAMMDEITQIDKEIEEEKAKRNDIGNNIKELLDFLKEREVMKEAPKKRKKRPVGTRSAPYALKAKPARPIPGKKDEKKEVEPEVVDESVFQW